MHEIGIYTIYPKINLSKRNFKEAIVPYLLRNDKVAEIEESKLQADIHVSLIAKGIMHIEG